MMKPGELVDGVERLLQSASARDPEVVACEATGAHELGREARGGSSSAMPVRGWPVHGVHVGIALVVEVVEHPDEAPFLSSPPNAGA
jgi:hypothetical protein